MAEDHMTTPLRVLVVEDETLIGALLEDMLGELGATIIGPIATRAEALAAAERDNFDVALVDMNLRGEKADDVARRLAARNVPFVLASGSSEVDSRLGPVAVLRKPFIFSDVEIVVDRLRHALGKAQGSGG